MANIQTLPHNYLISVDSYTENFKDGVFTCQCFTPGMKGEKSHIVKTVTREELEYEVCSGQGKVEVTYQNDPENTDTVTFWQWYDGLRFSLEIREYMADIINRRDKRIPFVEQLKLTA